MLSVYDGDQISPEQSWLHFTKNPKCSSAGTMAVTVDEVVTQDLEVRPDPELFAEHAVVDFTGLSKNEIEHRGKRLTLAAVRRGWLYRSA